MRHKATGWAGRPAFVPAGVFVALALAAGPALPQGRFALPAGCEAYVTVHKADCTMSHLFICAGDPQGHQRRVDLNETGLIYMGVIDAETRWIESFHASTGQTVRLVPGAADPASLTDLIATGRDTMEFETLSDMFGITRYTGEDRLTGETVVIDGVELQRTEFTLTVQDAAGQTAWQVRGREFIHPGWRTFLSGTRTYVTEDGDVTEDATPVEFIFPGEPGFLGTSPRHGCDMMMSQTGQAGPLPATLRERS